MDAVETLLDTRTVPPRDRFDYWHEMVRHAVVPITTRSDHSANFVATIQVLDLGILQVTKLRYPSLEAWRTPKLIRQSDTDIYGLGLVLHGAAAITSGRQHATLGSNEFVLQDYSRPSHMFHSVGSVTPRRPTLITITASRDALPVSSQGLRRLHAVRMSGRDGAGALLSHYLTQLIRHADGCQSSDVTRLATVTLDLIGVVLAHHLGVDQTLPPASRERVTLARIHAHIEQHLGDPALSPRSIAAAHHISLRTLYRLFDSEKNPVARLIRTRRLERCRQELTDTSSAGRPISAVARRWGLINAAHFSRAFRDAYGVSPQDYRQRHQSAAGLWSGVGEGA